MNDTQINIQKSKLLRKVVRKANYFNESIYIILIAIIIFCIILGTYELVKVVQDNHFVLSILIICLSIIITLLFLIVLVRINILKKVPGITKDENRKAIRQIIFESKWTIQTDNIEILIANKPWNFWSLDWSRQLIVIFDRNDILINSTSFGKTDIKSPFHWFINRKTENIFINEFNNLIRATNR